MPARSLRPRSDSRALSRCSRMKSPSSRSRCSTPSATPGPSRSGRDLATGQVGFDHVDHAMELAPPLGDLTLQLAEAVEGFVELAVGEGGEVGGGVVGDERLAAAGPLDGRRRREVAGEPARRGIGTGSGVGEDVRQDGHETGDAPAALPTVLLGAEDLHARLRQAAHVRDLRLDLETLLVHPAHVVDVAVLEVLEITGTEHDVDATRLVA